MVEEYLTDRDQEEALRNWWRENWKFILAGIAIGLAGLGGYTYYQKYRDAQADHAAKVYADFQKALASNDDTQAGKLLDSLAGDHATSAYTQQGRLLLAKRHTEAGRFDQAIQQLRQVMDSSRDEDLGHIAQLRLARLLIQTGKHDDALKVLDVEKAGAFAAQVHEIRGDAHLAKGDAQGARAEYAAALSADTKGEIDRATVELKLRDVGGDVPAAPKPATAPAAKGDS
ncbi:MAG TPA: tetratricopeptide repeat protein [Steroidobacteraceae bacterium]|jgi:predicted negative regulator of RcsB-dependent stress response